MSLNYLNCNGHKCSLHLIIRMSFHVDPQTRHPVRLVGGASPAEGRVEIFINRTWYAVCDTFGVSSDLVCNQLGFFGNSSVVYHGQFGHGKYTVCYNVMKVQFRSLSVVIIHMPSVSVRITIILISS